MTGTTGLTVRAEPELAKVAGALQRLPAHQRGFACSRVLAELDGAAKLVRELRASAIAELRAQGLAWGEIAQLLDTAEENVRRWGGATRAGGGAPAAPSAR